MKAVDQGQSSPGRSQEGLPQGLGQYAALCGHTDDAMGHTRVREFLDGTCDGNAATLAIDDLSRILSGARRIHDSDNRKATRPSDQTV